MDRRDPFLIAAGVFLASLTILVVVQSFDWIGRPFPGFLLLENRVIPSAGLTRWPATATGEIYQFELVSVDGERLENVEQLRRKVESIPVGTPLAYRLQRGEVTLQRVIKTRLFDRLDWLLLFGSLALSGIVLGGTGLMILYLRGRDALSLGCFNMLYITAIFALTAVDLYGPHRLFRLHAFAETLVPAGFVHMALVFPRPLQRLNKHRALIPLLYLSAGALGVWNQIGLYDPDAYRITHQLATTAFGLSCVILVGVQLFWYFGTQDFEIRQRIKVVAFGATASLSIPVVLTLGATFTGGATPQNASAFTVVFYPISIGYAVLRHNLLEVDVFVRRTLNYALLTILATLSYVGTIQVFESIFGAIPGASDSLGFIVTAGLVVFLLPMRDRVQRMIDRVFFRTAYDFRRVVETASERLSTVSDLHVIANELRVPISETLHPVSYCLYIRRSVGSPFQAFPPVAKEPFLADATIERLEQAKNPLDRPGGGLYIPCHASRALVAILALGRPRSGRIYGADDRRLLQTLANQAAIAIENALALEELRDLNRDLEVKVQQRTEELRKAHAQLVHREKMASLGQFVAGIAHELNNPLNFIQGNLHCLQTLFEELKHHLVPPNGETCPPAKDDQEINELIADVLSAFEGCFEGVSRSTTLVRDLRTFSRRDEGARAVTDLQASLESTLNLLRNRLIEIEVVREYEEIPQVECLSGQINQVFVNLISNACDAMQERGRLTLRTRRDGPDHVQIEIEDTGEGIDPAVVDRVFDPFFTTKEVGKGTGLGLSISYGIISRHGGQILVQSDPGGGTCFTIHLPIKSWDPDELAASAPVA